MTSRQQLIILLFVIGVPLVAYVGLRPFSPQGVESEIYAVKFLEAEGYTKRYQLQGDAFDCQARVGDPVVVCQTMFEGAALAVEMVYEDEAHHFAKTCAAFYAGERVDCQASWGYENPAGVAIIRSDLGITAARFAELRQENWWLYWQESDWITAVHWLSFVLAVGLGGLYWLWLGRGGGETAVSPVLRLLQSVLTGLFVWFIVAWGSGIFLGYWFADFDWGWLLLPWLGTLAALVAVWWRWRVLAGWWPSTVWFRLLASVGQTAVLFIALNFLLFINLLFLGFLD